MTLGLELLLYLGFISLMPIYFLFLHDGVSHNLQKGSRKELPILCYFSMERDWPNNGTKHPALNATLCTHIIFIATGVEDCEIAVNHPNDTETYFSKILLLRKQNPKLKFLVCNGGGGSHGFSMVLGSRYNRTRFVKSAIPFMKKYDFDGLDVDFEFPGWNLPVDQRRNYTMLLQELRHDFNKESKKGKKYILSAAVAAGRSVMEIYDVPAMAKSLDFINLMCYDYHSYNSDYDPITGYNSPLYPTDWMKKIVITSGNVGWSSYEWFKRGMPKSKIMVGIPTYTHTWTLQKPAKYHGVDAPATGPGKSCNECRYPWVCNFMQNSTRMVWDNDAAVPYAYKGDQWVSYDNVQSLTAKANWIKGNEFGGIMVYNMNSDDFYGTCNEGKFPLISAIKGVVSKNNPK